MKYSWSVLICCHNSESRLTPALHAIAALNRGFGDAIEVVVVDNASTDKTQEIVGTFVFPKGFDIRLVVEKKPGLSNARRAAIEAARGKWLCFVDDDNDLRPDYLLEAERIFTAHADVVFCGGRSMWHENVSESELPIFVRYFAKAIAVGDQRSFEAGYVRAGDFLWGAGLCLRASEAQRLYSKGFSPVLSGRVGKRVMSGEDGELVQLLQLWGQRGYYCRRLALIHRVDTRRFTLLYFLALFYGMGLALPAVRAYSSAVRAINSSDSQIESSKLQRLTRFDWGQRIYIGFFYVLFGCFFYCGAAVASWSGVGRRARSQATRLQAKEHAC